MITPSVSAAGGAPVDPREASVKKAAADMQGLFVQQLYKVMRESVPKDGGLVEQSQGEEVFSALMDERLAADTGTRWQRGLGDAIYRALRQKAGLGDAPSASPSAPGTIPSATPPVPPVRFP